MHETFVENFHLPPHELRTQPSRILDLGSNIGLTVAHFAALYPDANILGIELDEANAAIARSNVAGYGDRCQILSGAVWWNRDDLSYAALPGHEYGFRVSPNDSGNGEVRTAKGITMNELVNQLSPDGVVDYVKMDIEGAERYVLTRETDWAMRVRSMKVEVHSPYGPEGCIADLERLGFRTRRDAGRPTCVVAIRDQRG